MRQIRPCRPMPKITDFAGAGGRLIRHQRLRQGHHLGKLAALNELQRQRQPGGKAGRRCRIVERDPAIFYDDIYEQTVAPVIPMRKAETGAEAMRDTAGAVTLEWVPIPAEEKENPDA